jgi:hypothetical protein
MHLEPLRSSDVGGVGRTRTPTLFLRNRVGSRGSHVIWYTVSRGLKKNQSLIFLFNTRSFCNRSSRLVCHHILLKPNIAIESASGCTRHLFIYLRIDSQPSTSSGSMDQRRKDALKGYRDVGLLFYISASFTDYWYTENAKSWSK